MNILHTFTGVGEVSSEPHRRQTPHSGSRLNPGFISILTLFALLLHGYHPFAEDGGLYVAGIKRLLNPALYPAFAPFVTAHLRFSLFAPLVAGIVRATHLPLEWVLFALYLATIWATLSAAWSLAARCTPSLEARAGAVVLLACWLTLPIAGTSLMLMDPYLTARSFSTPLALWALAFVLDATDAASPSPRRSALHCALALLVAGALHPLMAFYALASVTILVCAAQPSRRSRTRAFAILAILALLAAAAVQAFAPPESSAYVHVAMTRYYWFPFRWQWYEQLGLLAPLAVIAALFRHPGAAPAWRTLARAAIALAIISAAVALCFAHAHYATHLVARLQPLRCFQLVYEIMILLLGAFLGEVFLRREPIRWSILLLALAGTMFAVERQTFPASAHLEFPGRTSPNPWVQAFLWVRQKTPADAVFALDAHYIIQAGEDAQTFRAIAERSALPDYSKDGGEASITPSLTKAWTSGERAQTGLDLRTDDERIAALKPLGATWIILGSSAATAFPCPYRNQTVKVCRLP